MVLKASPRSKIWKINLHLQKWEDGYFPVVGSKKGTEGWGEVIKNLPFDQTIGHF